MYKPEGDSKIMRHYEILILINPDQSNQISAMLDRYLSIISKGGGTVHRQEDWGKQQLAYQINKSYKAHYLLLNVECVKDTILELKNVFKFNDAVLRSLVTKCEEAITEKSVFLKNRENEKSNYNNTNKDNNYSNVNLSKNGIDKSDQKINKSDKQLKNEMLDES